MYCVCCEGRVLLYTQDKFVYIFPFIYTYTVMYNSVVVVYTVGIMVCIMQSVAGSTEETMVFLSSSQTLSHSLTHSLSSV